MGPASSSLPPTLLCLSSGWKRARARARVKMPQLKVVLAAGCSGSLGPARDVANALPSGSTLVPEGAVDGALICLYGKGAASGWARRPEEAGSTFRAGCHTVENGGSRRRAEGS